MTSGRDGAVTRSDLDRLVSWCELLESVPLAALLLSPAGEVLAVNGAWTVLSGVDRHDSTGSGWMRAIDGGAVGLLRAQLVHAVESGTTQSHECQLVVGSERRWTRWWWRPRANREFLVCVADIATEKAREQELWLRATHDSLTGLTNRSEVLCFVDRALHRAQRNRRPPAVVYVDLDDFKTVNDQGGHRVGDQLLRAVGERLPLAVRPTDIAVRVGGDEFAVLCEDLTGTEDVILIADRIHSLLHEPVIVDGRTFVLRATTGFVFASNGDEPEGLLARADTEMYAAKRHKRSESGSSPHLVTRPVLRRS